MSAALEPAVPIIRRRGGIPGVTRASGAVWEGDQNGPTFCYRGFNNSAYYVLEPDRIHYSNYSGTGNTLNANHPIVRRMIVDSLRYWVQEMHVDGFRFDLASILARDSNGCVLSNPPVLWDIESDPCLAGTKMIAEAGPCGLWPRDLGPSVDGTDTTNHSYWNFGCSQQRNLAAMVDNPADLVQPRGETPSYAARRAFMMDKYRKGVDHAYNKARM